MAKKPLKVDQSMSLAFKDTADLRRDETPVGVDQPDAVPPPDPEVTSRNKRRYHTAAYKKRILRKADACAETGDLAKLLRSEGLYSSHLTQWRQQLDNALEPRKRGRKRDPDKALRQETEKLRREIDRLNEKLRKAEVIIDVQKKLSTLLGIQLPTVP
jgi:transposase-like protein